MRMLRGYVEAFGSSGTFADVLVQYSGEDRTIVRRILDLSPSQVATLAHRLEVLSPRARSTYRYHHFRDNCSTRLADLLDEALGHRLSALHTSPAEGTFRTRVLAPVRSQLFLYAALDTSYSAVVDRPISRWETTFLPEGFGELVDATEFDGRPFVRASFEAYRSL